MWLVGWFCLFVFVVFCLVGLGGFVFLFCWVFFFFWGGGVVLFASFVLQNHLSRILSLEYRSDETSIRFIRRKSLNSIPNSIQMYLWFGLGLFVVVVVVVFVCFLLLLGFLFFYLFVCLCVCLKSHKLDSFPSILIKRGMISMGFI